MELYKNQIKLYNKWHFMSSFLMSIKDFQIKGDLTRVEKSDIVYGMVNNNRKYYD